MVAEGRREPLHSDHSNRPRSGCGSDLFFLNLEHLRFALRIYEVGPLHIRLRAYLGYWGVGLFKRPAQQPAHRRHYPHDARSHARRKPYADREADAVIRLEGPLAPSILLQLG